MNFAKPPVSPLSASLDPWAATVTEWLIARRGTFLRFKMSTEVLLKQAVGCEEITQKDRNRMGVVMRSLGYEREQAFEENERGHFWSRDIRLPIVESPPVPPSAKRGRKAFRNGTAVDTVIGIGVSGREKVDAAAAAKAAGLTLSKWGRKVLVAASGGGKSAYEQGWDDACAAYRVGPAKGR